MKGLDLELECLVDEGNDDESETKELNENAADDEEASDPITPVLIMKRTGILQRIRSYRPLVATIVFIAFFVDSILVTSVVPTLPTFLPNTSNISRGVLLSSKSFFQLVSGFFVGPLTDKVGFNTPLLAGFILLTSSTLVMAFAAEIGRSVTGKYVVIFLARSVEGVGCSFAATAGMALVADRYPDDAERGKVMGRVLGGIGLGTVVGYPFGGAFSGIPGGVESGWKYPFLIIAVVGFSGLVLHILVLGSRVHKKGDSEAKPSSMWTLFKDPHVALGFVVLMFSQMPIAVSEPLVPAWMMREFKPEPKPYSIGLVLMSVTLSYLLTVPLAGKVSGKYRWIGVLLGMIVMICGLMTLPLAALPHWNNLYYSIGPLALIGIGIGLTDSLMYPVMGGLADLRHNSVYGGIYAISDVAINLGFVVGPLYSSGISELVNFNWAMWSVGILVIFCWPFIWFFKSPKAKITPDKTMGSPPSVQFIQLQNKVESESDV